MPDQKILTRRELYELVWATPIQKLAADFGISDVGLAKICERHRVPTPTRGYWAKVRAGQKVKRTIFVEISDQQLNRIAIQSPLTSLPPEARAIVEKVRADRAAKRLLKVREEFGPQVSFSPVQDPHTAIRATAQSLRKVPPGGAAAAGGDGKVKVSVGAESVERVVALLDQLARKLDDVGIRLEPLKGALGVAIGPDSATFSIVERTRREAHEPTPKEFAAEERRQRRQRISWSYEHTQRAYPEFDTVYSGELVLEADGYSEGVRRKWADGKTQRLEGLVDQVVGGLQALLAVRKATREKHEEWKRNYEEQQRRRELSRRRAQREEARLAYLADLLDKVQEIERIQHWLTRLESRVGNSSDLDRMTAWARERLAKLQGVVDPQRLNEELGEKRLFPAEDELHDPLGEPPGSYWT